MATQLGHSSPGRDSQRGARVALGVVVAAAVAGLLVLVFSERTPHTGPNTSAVINPGTAPQATTPPGNTTTAAPTK
jgi:hypothetical protein